MEPNDQSPIAQLVGVGVRFGEIQALQEVYLALRSGECLALLGPNGAGKSTLCRALLGLVRPSSGQVRVWGQDPSSPIFRTKVLARIGSQVETPGLPPHVEPLAYLEHYGRLYGIPSLESRKRAKRWLSDLDLPSRGKADQLSQGQRLRLQLARALLHDPDLVLLDEPTSTLDPEAQELLWNLLRQWQARQQATLLVCTHALEEAFQYADRVAVLAQGKLCALGTPAALLDVFPSSRQLRLEAPTSALNLTAILSGVGIEAQVEESEFAQGFPAFRLRTSRGEMDHPRVLASLCEAGIGVRTLSVDARSLRETYSQALTAPTLTGFPLVETTTSSVPKPSLKSSRSMRAIVISPPSRYEACVSAGMLQWDGLRHEPKLLLPILILLMLFLGVLWLGGAEGLSGLQQWAMIAIAGVLPIGAGAALCADSYAGERERKSLETLLSAPVSTGSLFLGKVLAVAIPTLLLSWISSGLAAWILNLRDCAPSLIAVLVLWFGFLPGAVGFACGWTTFLSTRAKTVRSAAQGGGAAFISLAFGIQAVPPVLGTIPKAYQTMTIGLGLLTLWLMALLIGLAAARRTTLDRMLQR